MNLFLLVDVLVTVTQDQLEIGSEDPRPFMWVRDTYLQATL
jgi:hypothetical protein